MINIDWFQPFKHIRYSVGIIYLSILNLPHDIWIMPKNIILVDILTGLNEPSYDINGLIKPLIKALNIFWIGKEMKVHGKILQQLVRCAVLFVCASCDLPAVGSYVDSLVSRLRMVVQMLETIFWYGWK